MMSQRERFHIAAARLLLKKAQYDLITHSYFPPETFVGIDDLHELLFSSYKPSAEVFFLTCFVDVNVFWLSHIKDLFDDRSHYHWWAELWHVQNEYKSSSSFEFDVILSPKHRPSKTTHWKWCKSRSRLLITILLHGCRNTTLGCPARL